MRVENKELQKALIEKIHSVDKENIESFMERVMLHGWKGYYNMNELELIKIYLEYYGIESLNELLISVAEKQNFAFENFKHLAFSHDEHEKDLYINYYQDYDFDKGFDEKKGYEILYCVFKDGNFDDTKDLEVALSWFGLSDKELLNGK